MKEILGILSKEYSAVIVILVAGVLFSLVSPYFLTRQNLRNVLLRCTASAIVASGQALIVISGNSDSFFGQCVCFSSVIRAYLIRLVGVGPWIIIFCTSIARRMVGLCNGLLVAYIGLPVFIVTLGTQMVCQSLSEIITNTIPIAGLPEETTFLGRGYLGSIPICALIMLAVYAVAQFVSTKTRPGRNIFAIGGRSEAVYSVGILTKRYSCITYVIGSLLTAVGGVLLISRLDSVPILNGSQCEFGSPIACVIGGLSTTGGRGRAVDVLFGAIFLIMFSSGTTMMDIEPLYQNTIKGTVLIITITADVLQDREKNRDGGGSSGRYHITGTGNYKRVSGCQGP